MKRYLKKIAFFFIAVAVVDVLFGFVCQYMNNHSKGGGVKNRYYVCKESNEDVLVFGSSRAKHHYVPDIIEDSLGVTCYNTGEDGNGIIYCYGILKMIIQRYSPKLIIYDVSDFDIYEDDNMKYVDLLKPYYFEPGIDSIFWSVNPKTRYMMLSNLYRYNTTCLRVLGNYVHPMTNYPKGYFALNNTMNYEPVRPSVMSKSKPEDKLKIQFFESFINLAQTRGVELVCCVSPNYKGLGQSNSFQTIEELCQKYNVPFINNNYDKKISDDMSLFYDRTHMNNRGANLYTQNLMSSLISRNIVVMGLN